MARARNIKPSFFTNEVLGQLEPIACLLFIGLWTLADRDGILEDRPLRIKAELFPYREKLDVNRYLTDLERLDFIMRYSHESGKFIYVKNFSKHQNPHNTEKAKGFPKPPELPGKLALTPLDNGYSPADSLIPDSLIPDSNIMSGKPDDSRQLAKELIDFLNLKAGKAFRHTDANIEPIVARLKEGYTLQDMKTVTVRKCRDWATDEKMVEYLRPATLYNRTKFNQYIGECVEVSE